MMPREEHWWYEEEETGEKETRRRVSQVTKPLVQTSNDLDLSNGFELFELIESVVVARVQIGWSRSSREPSGGVVKGRPDLVDVLLTRLIGTFGRTRLSWIRWFGGCLSYLVNICELLISRYTKTLFGYNSEFIVKFILDWIDYRISSQIAK